MSFLLRVQQVTALLCLGASMIPGAAAEWAWTTPTPGAANIAATTGPVLQETVSQEVPIASVTVVVNEVFPSGSNLAAEFVELYNYGNIDVDASGLMLSNRAGKTIVIPADMVIPSKGYLTLRGLLPLTDSGDTVTLQRGAEEIDRLEFDTSMVKDSFSAGRYCDVYELRFCDTKSSVPTPDAVNELEVLKVWVEPADGVLRPGQKPQFFTNIREARILISPLPSMADEKKSFVYSAPLSIEDTVTYWYYAQHGSQATVPQKVVFQIDREAPTEAQMVAAKGMMINEIMIDSASKTGWIEVLNTGGTAVDLDQLRLDTRANPDADCTNCLHFAGAPRLSGGAYKVIELPRATVSTLLQRQTPVEVRLMLGNTLLSSLQAPLQQQGQGVSWVPTTGAVLIGEHKTLVSWTDIPTPGQKNLVVHFATSMATGTMTPQLLARTVYAQAAYEDTLLVLRGKALPGAELTVMGNGALLATMKVSPEGIWEMKLPHEKIRHLTHVFFRLKSPEGTVGLLSAPFALPAFDGKDPRQATATTNLRAKQPAAIVKQPASSRTSPASGAEPFADLPLLSTMTGVTLTTVPTGYDLESGVLALIPEEEGTGMLARLRSMLTTMLFFSR